MEKNQQENWEGRQNKYNEVMSTNKKQEDKKIRECIHFKHRGAIPSFKFDLIFQNF